MTDPAPPAPPAALTTQQFIELGRVPDFVRELQPFDGRPAELADWLADVDSIFRVYREKGATACQISLLERTVRRKLKGEAADILNANNITTSWTDIKNTLILYYRDKRDIKTLDYELTSVKKASSECLSSYYSRVNELLSLIIAQIQTDDKLKVNAAAHTDYFRDKSLDAFIRGLERPLNILVKSSNPKSLGQAYQFCVDYYNMDVRSSPYRNEFGGLPTPKPREPPKIPPRLPVPAPRQFVPQQPRPISTNPFQNPRPLPVPFQPSTSYRPNNPFFQPFSTYRPSNPSIQRPPQPMEIDPSSRTRNFNRDNRPPINMKRSHPSSQLHQDFKRQAHPLDNSNENYETLEGYDDNHYNNPFHDATQHEQYDDSYYQTEQFSADQEESYMPPEANFLEWHPRW